MSQFTLYRLRDNGGDLLYVGVSRRPERRIHWHLKSQPGREMIDPSRTTHEVFSDGLAASIAERAAIASEAPEFNKAGVFTAYIPVARRRGRRAAPAVEDGALTRLVDLAREIAEALDQRPVAIHEARTAGFTWDEVAHGLSLSRAQAINIHNDWLKKRTES